MQSERQRRVIAVLLLFSCITALGLLWKTEPVIPQKLSSPVQLDSLIVQTFEDLEIRHSQFQKRTVRVDSVFSRSVYNLKVAPNFSKTTLHYNLQEALWPYQVKTVARVEFPDRTMHMHFLVNQNIHRSLIITEDLEVNLEQDQPIILPGQDSHEVD